MPYWLVSMTYSSNIKQFFASEQSELVQAYHLLIGIELVLKDAGYAGSGGHDVPGMLSSAANSPKAVAKPGVEVRLRGLAVQLTNALRAVTCQGLDDRPQSVPSTSYPFLRYCRLEGDWNGERETSALRITELLATCNNVLLALKDVGKTIGVKI